MRKKLFKRSVWTMFTIFFVIILAIVVVANSIAKEYEGWVDAFFGVTRYQLVANEDEDADPDETQYFVSDYANRDENGKLVLTQDENGIYHQTYNNDAMRANSMDVATRVGEEGSVLLWNKNNALPLASGEGVSLFGVSSVEWMYHGIGSGKIAVTGTFNSFKDALESSSLKVNSKLMTIMRLAKPGYGASQEQYSSSYPDDVLKYANHFGVGEIPWDVLNSTASGKVENTVADYGTAIYTVSRNGGEGSDAIFPFTENDEGNYLCFTRDELSVLQGLKGLKQEGKLSKIVLLFNTATTMSLKGIQEYMTEDYGIDACLWVGMGGQASLDYVSNLLAGKANPSGRLSDTWVYDIDSAPANENFGAYTYTDTDGIPQNMEPGYTKNFNDKYVVYQEGIYVGYRYYETRYEDTVLGKGNANSVKGVKAGSGVWKYSDEVAYTFGYGGSYTTFSYSPISVAKKGDNYEVSMTIKNIGNYAGKEVMQVYLQKPYTQYDIDNKVEKSAVELVGFNKTKLLEPGEEQTLTVTVPEYEFKSYDAYGAGTYILERSDDYYLAVGTDAHNALNNILAKKGYKMSDGMDAEGDASLVYQARVTASTDKYSVSPFTNEEITNQFNDVDVNLYEGTQGQTVTYLSRNDWNATYPSAVSISAKSATMKKDLQYGKDVVEDPDAEMPLYETVTSEYGALSLIQLLDIPFDNPLWDDLLNQMTFEEQVDIMRRGAHNIAGATSITAPGFRATDGPCGIGGVSTALDIGRMALPCNGLVASTFNTELVEELGNAFAMEILHVGFVGLYGVGANIHRSAYGGRTWEYYSEDGFLSGAMNSAESKGLTSKGIVLFTKHFALNEQETCRDGGSTWANEQSIREIYLKAFETGVTDGYTNGIMTAYSRIGCTWTGLHKGLLTNVLRGEWGFTGLTETDSPTSPHMRTSTNTIYASGLIAGQDVWMGSTGEEVLNEYKDNATVMQALREAAHRVLYVMLNSAAMNGVTSSTHSLYVVPAWEKAITAVEVVSGILAGACLVLTAVSWVFWAQDKKKEK